MVGRKERKGDFFPHHSNAIRSLLDKERECLFLVPSLFQMSLVKVLKNNVTKYFSLTSYSINKNIKKKRTAIGREL